MMMKSDKKMMKYEKQVMNHMWMLEYEMWMIESHKLMSTSEWEFWVKVQGEGNLAVRWW